VVIEGVPQDVGEGEDGMPIDEALMKPLADVADKVIDIDLGTSQAQRRFTAHGNEVLALSTIEASVVEVADLLRIATGEHLVDQLIIVSGIITGIELLNSSQ
jgi:hypothetical protein